MKGLWVIMLVLAMSATTWVESTAGSEEKVMERRTNPIVAMETSLGTIKIELWPAKAPVTVKNFLRYVDEGFYDGTIFHRVIDNFMIQGGGFTADMTNKPANPPIKNEAKAELKNDRGTIAMARTRDLHSATSQFFINLKDNDFLNHHDETTTGFGYAVFGKVIEGMDVVAKIGKVKTTTSGPYRDVPAQPVVIKHVERLESTTQGSTP
jgi:cyclophilin family peptidyl-prolyl cis-trans isomerase